jgi:hypothetical protein
MAKTRVTQRVKASAEDNTDPMVASVGQPGTPVSSVTVTDAGTTASGASAKLNDEELVDTDDDMPILRKRKDYFADDPMDLDRKLQKANPKEDTFDDDDEIPVGDGFIGEETKVEAEDSGNDEDFPLGNNKKPGLGKTGATSHGNGRSGIPVASMLVHIKLSTFAYAYLAMVSYGFTQDGVHKPGFHNYVLRTMVVGEECPFYTTRNVGEDSLVELVDNQGDAINVSTVTGKGKAIQKQATAVWIITRHQLPPAKLNALFAGFLETFNTAQWNGSELTQKVAALTPEHFIHPCDGIGPYVGQTGCEKIIKRFYDDFRPHNRWGGKHKELLASLWNPGGWTLDNATYFGAPRSWMKTSEQDKYAAQVANRNNNGDSNK